MGFHLIWMRMQKPMTLLLTWGAALSCLCSLGLFFDGLECYTMADCFWLGYLAGTRQSQRRLINKVDALSWQGGLIVML